MSSSTTIGASTPLPSSNFNLSDSQAFLKKEMASHQHKSLSLEKTSSSSLVVDSPVAKTTSIAALPKNATNSPDISTDSSTSDVAVPISQNIPMLLQSRFITNSEREALAAIAEAQSENVSEHSLESIQERDHEIEDISLSETSSESEEKDASVTHPLEFLQRKDLESRLAG